MAGLPVAQMRNIHKEALALFEKRKTDYGDSFAAYGSIGMIVRAGDKISRLSSVTKDCIRLGDSESVRDALIDLHNYAAMAIVLLDGRPSEARDRQETDKAHPDELEPLIPKQGEDSPAGQLACPLAVRREFSFSPLLANSRLDRDSDDSTAC